MDAAGEDERASTATTTMAASTDPPIIPLASSDNTAGLLSSGPPSTLSNNTTSAPPATLPTTLPTTLAGTTTTTTTTTSSTPPRLPQSPPVAAAAALGPALPQSYNVDYFSHAWDEFDLKTSWSVMTKRKKTHIDGIRLENASWRKWMQKKWKLRRVPPELLRWKKDEDITWLYGPFCPSTGANYFSVMEDQAVGASGAATAAAASVLATGKIDTTGDDMPATTTTTTTMDTERALRFRRASTHYANYTSTDRSSLLDDHVAANGQVPSSPSTVSAPLPTTPPAAASAVAASGTTGKRSALKSVHQVWLAELRKFALDMDRRLMVKYPRGRRGSVGGDGIIGTGIMSVGMVGDTAVEPRRVTLGPTTSLPSYPRHRQVDTATAMVVLRETYRSDSDLFQHPTLVSDQHVAAYMAPAEIALLQQMDDGPALNDQQVDDALVDAAASASLSDGQGVPPETQPQQRRNKLRFSAEVEVLEFPTDHGSVGTPTVPGRRSSRSRKISVPVPATSAAAAVAPVVPVPVVASVVPTPSTSTTAFSDPVTSATSSDEPSPPTRPRNTSLVDLLVGMASYVGKLVAPSTSTSTSSGSNSSSDHPQASPRETSLTRPK